MIKCYQVRRPELVVKGAAPYTMFYQGPIKSPLIATIDSDSENLEVIWDCCNNSCWWDEDRDCRDMKEYDRCGTKFNVEFTKDYMGYCNNDLIVEMGDTYHIALSFGWHTVDTLKEAVEYVSKNSYECHLYTEEDQYPTGREMSMSELKEMKAKAESEGYRCGIYGDVEEE